MNARSSIEAELIAIDDKIAKVIWTKKFFEEQGFQMENAQDILRLNISTSQTSSNAIKYQSNSAQATT